MVHRLFIKFVLAIAVSAIAILAFAVPAKAQNPLRSAEDNSGFVSNQTSAQTPIHAVDPPPHPSLTESPNQVPPAVYAAMYQQRSQYPAVEPSAVEPSLPAQPQRDHQATFPPQRKLPPTERPADTNGIAQSADLAPVISMLDQLQTHAPVSYIEEDQSAGLATATNVQPEIAEQSQTKRRPLVEAENVLANLNSQKRTEPSVGKSDGKFASDGSRMRLLAEKLAINTVIVMVCGVGFILIAKQWFKLKQPASKSSDLAFEIKSKIQVAPKSHLMLVHLGSERLVVATDASGVKSVLRLTETFADTLDSLAEDEIPAALPAEILAAEKATETEVRPTEDRYSLAMLGNSTPAEPPERDSFAPAANAKARVKNAKPRADQAKANEAAIRKQMEEALAKHGLKDLILHNLQASR